MDCRKVRSDCSKKVSDCRKRGVDCSKTVKKLGINVDDYCDCNAENVKDWILQKTNGNGADVFFECVGKNETIVQAIENTIPGGKIQLFGHTLNIGCCNINT